MVDNDDDDDDGDDNSDGAAGNDNDDSNDNDDDKIDDVDNDNLPPRIGKRNDGCNETKMLEEEETVTDSVVIHTTIKQITGRGARLPIPVFRNLFFGSKKPFLTGFLRISFFPAFSGGILHRNVVLERSQEFLFFPFLQDFFAEIPVGQEFLYLPQNPPDSGGFLFPPKAAGSGQQLKKALC